MNCLVGAGSTRKRRPFNGNQVKSSIKMDNRSPPRSPNQSGESSRHSRKNGLRQVRLFTKFWALAGNIVGTFLITGFFAECYIRYWYPKLKSDVYRKLVVGSRPMPVPTDYAIKRKDENLLYWFIRQNLLNTEKHFGVVVGPTGTGKTSVTRNLANKHLEGTIYLEVREPSLFTKELAKEIGMKTEPSNFIDILLSYYSETYTLYYSLPSNKPAALDKVMDAFTEVCKKFYTEYHHYPTLFIDGVDLLAKAEEETFSHLLMQAKRLANDGIATVVLVSSEGTVVPVIQEFSGSSRPTRLFEIGDVPDDLAEEHLVKMGLPNNLAKKLVGYLGGRCVYMYNACFNYSRYHEMKMYADDDEMFTQIIKDMWALQINGQCKILALCKPYSRIIIKSLAKNEEIVPADLIEEREGSEREGMECAIQRFVKENILCYTAEGKLQWHGRPQKLEFGNYHLVMK